MTKYLQSGPMFFSSVKGSSPKRDPEHCDHSRKKLVGSRWVCVDCGSEIKSEEELADELWWSMVDYPEIDFSDTEGPDGKS